MTSLQMDEDLQKSVTTVSYIYPLVNENVICVGLASMPLLICSSVPPFYYLYMIVLFPALALTTHAWQQRLGTSQEADYLPCQDTLEVSQRSNSLLCASRSAQWIVIELYRQV